MYLLKQASSWSIFQFLNLPIQHLINDICERICGRLLEGLQLCDHPLLVLGRHAALPANQQYCRIAARLVYQSPSFGPGTPQGMFWYRGELIYNLQALPHHLGCVQQHTLLACYAVSRWSCCRNIFQSALPDLPHQRRKVILVTSMNTTVASFVKAASCMVTAISVCWRECCPVALSRLPGCVLQSFPF